MKKFFGSVLLSHTASRAVPSALKSLTSVFGMGTGVASSLLPPKMRYSAIVFYNLHPARNFYIQGDHVNYFAAKPHDQLVPVS